MWWWQTLGYTPAGIECWNAMRALDYLETRKEVDPKRVRRHRPLWRRGHSWWIAAADERMQCAVPVAGIADLQAHVCEGVATRFRKGVISGHCDCMYFVNTYRWDFAEVIALCRAAAAAPGQRRRRRRFFPCRATVAWPTRRSASTTSTGPASASPIWKAAAAHVIPPELRKGAFEWMNRWLKDDKSAVSIVDRPRFEPKQLKVFDQVPDDALNATIHEYFIKPAHVEMPKSPEVAREWWKGKSEEWRQQLREQRLPRLARQAAAAERSRCRRRQARRPSFACVRLHQ